MQIGDRLHQREAEAGARRSPRGIATIETFGGARTIFFRYTGSLIGDGHPDSPSLHRRRNVHRTVLRRELNRVVDEVGDCLLYKRRVTVDLQTLRMSNRQGDALFFRHGAIEIGDAFHGGYDVDPPE